MKNLNSTMRVVFKVSAAVAAGSLAYLWLSGYPTKR